MTAPNPRDFLIAVVGTFILTLFTLASCGRINPPVYHIGGANWRVFDANEVTSPEALDALRREFEDVRECVGEDRPFPPVVYSTSRIMYKWKGRWGLATGMWLSRMKGGGKDRIYLVTYQRAPGQVRETARHEFVHYLTQLTHPDVDPMVALCV